MSNTNREEDRKLKRKTVIYGYERLETFLTKQIWTSPEQLKTELIKDVSAYQGDTPQDDDIAILVMKV